MLVKLYRMGDSIAFTVPRAIAEMLEFHEGTRVLAKIQGVTLERRVCAMGSSKSLGVYIPRWLADRLDLDVGQELDVNLLQWEVLEQPQAVA